MRKLNFKKISTGAQNDLQQVTRIAYSMVTVYGMNEKIGNVSFYDPAQENQFTKPYSEETSRLIDEEVRKLIDKAYEFTKGIAHRKNATSCIYWRKHCWKKKYSSKVMWKP